MRFDKCALLCAVLALSILEPITARRGYSSRGGGGHSYPKSGGLSGGGSHHGYPSSGGLSGGGSHGYPTSGGMSGGGSHGYPSSGGLSGGGHGYPSSGNKPPYPSSGGSHGYPGSGGLSGSGSSNTHHPNNHGYPANNGLAGNTGHTTNIHHHYNYNPPQQISYAPVHGGAPVSYPVYRGSPPTYVYQYKNSGSKYGTLLAGLALLNLGALAGTAYMATHNSNSNSNSNYRPQPGEYCKFGLKKDNGDYEETKIDCQLITSFIFQEQQKPQSGAHNTTVTTTTVTNVTMVNTTNAVPQPPAHPTVEVNNTLYEMMPNGTLVPVNLTLHEMLPNGTLVPVNVTSTHNETAPAPVNPITSSVITTTNTTTVTNALDVKGQEVQVTPGMQCFVIRVTPTSTMRKTVPCGLLQTYAEKSLKRNSAARNAPAITILAAVLAAIVMY